jgi:hypothetical protein
MSLANAMTVKVKNTASRKMMDIFRGVVFQAFPAFSESGISFLISKGHSTPLVLIALNMPRQSVAGSTAKARRLQGFCHHLAFAFE